MKDLLCKQHYFYKIYTSLMKCSACRHRRALLQTQTRYMDCLSFLQENPDTSFYDFQNIDVYTLWHTFSAKTYLIKKSLCHKVAVFVCKLTN